MIGFLPIVKFESQPCHNHPWPGAKQAKLSVLSGSEGEYTLCQSQWHEPIIGNCELMYAEEGKEQFPLSILYMLSCL